jgi:hypothetical protein
MSVIESAVYRPINHCAKKLIYSVFAFYETGRSNADIVTFDLYVGAYVSLYTKQIYLRNETRVYDG